MDVNFSELLTAFQQAEKGSFTCGDPDALLDRVTGGLAGSSEAISDSTVYEALEELVLAYPTLDKKVQKQVVYLVTSSLHNQTENAADTIDNGHTDAFAAQKNYLEVYAYLVHCLFTYLGIESIPTSTGSKKVSNDVLENFKNNCIELESIMDAVCACFKLQLGKLFVTTPEKDLFVGAFTRPVYVLMESETRMKVVTVKMYMFKLISMAVKFHGHASAAQNAILQNLTYFVHLNAVMAELLQILNDQYDYPQLTEDVLREVSNKEFNPNDNNGPKQISLFIVKISELVPRVLLKQMTLVSQLLNNSSYTLRCAVVEACGNIIFEMSKDDDELERHRNSITALLDLLIERFLDQNPYVRTKATQSLLKLCEADAKFTKHRKTFMGLAVRSLQDKSSLVRRNAVRLMSRLVLTHPFGALHGTQLTLSVWQKRLEEAEKELTDLEPADTTEGIIEKNLEQDSDDDAYDELPSRIEKDSDTNAIFKVKLTIQYYNDAIEFIHQVHKGIDIGSQLLYSKNKNEVIETMDFFVLADAYSVENIQSGIRKMLHLVWMKSNSDEGTNVVNHLVECYKNLFLLAPDDVSELEAAALVAKNLISLTYNASVPELASLEKLLGLMYESSLINETIIKVLWQIYGFQNQSFSKKQRRGAIIVLGMLALSDSEVALKGIDSLLTIGLGEKGREDLVLAKYSCVALNRVVPQDSRCGSFRIPREEEAIRKLCTLLIEYNSNSEYYSVAEPAINTIFNISSDPEEIATQVIKEKTRITFNSLAEGQSEVVSLSQLLFIVGHVAIKVIVHLEALEGQFKKKKIEAEITKSNDKSGSAAEIEMIGGTSEDDFADAITFIKEKELLYGEHSLLAKFGQMVREICLNNLKYDNKVLQRSAVLCLEKLMCVSSKYCEDNLALLITIMEKSDDPVIRSNAVLGLGDMAVCFNNLVDENTDFLYRRLHDDDLMVKRTCLMTITFLILAGQVKVKGQLSQMAICLEDPDQGISDMCKLFFTELSTKDNAVYNGFIDIFSGLSSDENLGKDSMKRIIKFLLSFVEKERHQKQLSEKLLQRLAKVESEQQWNDVAFVLSALPNKNDQITQALEAGYTMVSARN